MRIRKVTALLAAFVLLTAASAKEGKKQAVKKPSNTRIASCLVKITCDPAVLPLSFDTIELLLSSSGVAGKASREILEIPMLTDETEELVDFGIEPLSDEPEDKRKGADFDEEYTREMRALGRKKQAMPMRGVPTYASEQPLFFRLEVELAEDEVKPAAEEFMKALLDNLRKTLDAAFDDYSKRFNQRSGFAHEDVQHAEANLVGLQDKLREILGSHNLERQAILDDISHSRKNLQATKMELETSGAFIEATSKRIEKTQADMNYKIKSDPVLAELQKIVKIHEERVTKLSKKGAAEPETSQARENLLRARIELAQRREEIRESAGGNLIDSLRNQISELTIERAQAISRINHLDIQLVEASDLLERADTYERFSLRLKIAKQTLEESLLLHSRMKRKSLLIQPSVVVFGAD